MSAATLQTLMRQAHGPVTWLLALALVAYGHSSVMVQLLGPAHRHDLVVASSTPSWLHSADAMFRDIREWRAELRQRLLPGQQAHVHGDGERHSHPHGYPYPHAEAEHAVAHDGGPHAHAHATYQRHHHDAQDTTVIALDGPEGASASDAASTAGAGIATLPLALAPRWAPTVMSDPDPAWSELATARWSDAAVSPPEHPPRA
jgi:hypothetical protein